MKKVVWVIALVLVLAVCMVGCGNTQETSNTNANIPKEPKTENVEVTEDVEAAEESKEPYRFSSYDEIPEEVVAESEDDESISEELKRIAIEELGIGFNTYSISFETVGKTIKVYGPQEGYKLHGMFASLEYLENHKVEFEYDGEGTLERYTPRTHESVGGYQGDNYGCVFEKDLETHTAIRGFGDGTLTITVDDTYTIIVNPKDEYTDNSEFFINDCN